MAVCRVTEWYEKPLIRLSGFWASPAIPESKAIGASRVFVSQKHHLLFPTKGRVIAHYNPCRVVGPPLRFGVVEQLDHGAGRHIAGQGFSGVDVVPIRHDPLPNAVGAFDVYVCR